MRSSFVRKGAAPARDPGTRAGLYGTTLISLGLVDLDRIVGGGLPLGTVLLLLEDPHSQQYTHILKYFVSEGVARGHKVRWLVPEEPHGGAAAYLPAQITSTSPQDKQKEGAGEGDTDLRIAWQYRKYLQAKQRTGEAAPPATASSRPARGGGGAVGAAAPQSRPAVRSTPSAVEAGVARQWCHVYDLSKPLGTDQLAASGLECCPMGRGGGDPFHKVVASSCEFVRKFRQQEVLSATGLPLPQPVPQGPESVGRLVVQGLGGASWGGGGEGLGRRLLQAVFQIRQQLQGARCAAVISCPAGVLTPSDALRLQHACDAVLSLEALSDDSPIMKLLPDSPSAAALLHVRKLPALGMLGPRLPEVALHVVRYKRKRITIQMIEIDPDAEEAEAAGGKSAAALLCSGPAAAPKALDF